MEKKEVKIVQEKANKRIMYIVIVLGILFLLFVAWIIKTQLIPVMEKGCSAYGEGYNETITEHTDSLTGKTYIEYKCCKKDDAACITVTYPKEGKK